MNTLTQRTHSLRSAHETLIATQYVAVAPDARQCPPNIMLRNLQTGRKDGEEDQLPIFTWWLELEPVRYGGVHHHLKATWTVSLQLRDAHGLGCTLVVVCCAANEHQARRSFASRHGTQYALMAEVAAGIVIDSVTEPVIPAIALNMMKMLTARREGFSFCARADYDLSPSRVERR